LILFLFINYSKLNCSLSKFVSQQQQQQHTIRNKLLFVHSYSIFYIFINIFLFFKKQIESK